jgi:hypothetical protein
MRAAAEWQIPTLPTATDNFEVISGFYTTFSGAASSVALFFRAFFDGTNVVLELRHGGTTLTSTPVTGVTLTNWNVYEVEIVGAWGASPKLHAWVNGTQVLNQTPAAATNMPSGAMQNGCGIRKTAGTTSRNMDVDWLAFQREVL